MANEIEDFLKKVENNEEVSRDELLKLVSTSLGKEEKRQKLYEESDDEIKDRENEQEEDSASSFVASGEKSFANYIKKVKDDNPVLTQQEEKDLLKRAKSGDSRAKEKIILSNFGLVLSIAQKYQNSNEISKEDLISEGISGLMKAFDGYDIESEVKFSTYAWKIIEQNIIRNKRTYKGVHFSDNILRKIREYKEIEAKLISQNTVVTDQLIASQMKINLDELQEIKYYAESKEVCSLDEPYGEDEEGSKYDNIPSQGELFSDSIINKMNNGQIIQLVFDRLDEDEKELLRYSSGYYLPEMDKDGNQRKRFTDKEISEKLGLTEKEVKNAIRRLRTKTDRIVQDLVDEGVLEESEAFGVQ